MRTIFLSFTINNSSLTDFFLMLSNKLTKSYRVVVITDRIEDHPFAVSPDIIFYQWPSSRPTKFRDFVFLFKKVRQYKPRVMVSMFGSVNLFLLVGTLLGVKHRLAWYHTISTASDSTKSLKFRKKFVYKMATRIIANSNATKTDLQENFLIPPEKISVVYNAVRPEKAGTNIKRNQLVYAGRLHPSKGIDTLVAAMPAVLEKFPDTQLILFGGHLEGNAIKKYIAQVKNLGISKSVIFKGTRPKQEVVEAFAESYVSILPSFFEAFGFVVIESFSVKTPVIGSDTSGIAEIIRDGKDGFLFKPGNEKDLSEKIIHLLQSPGLREDFSTNCFERFMDQFEVGSVTGKLFTTISSLD